MRIRTRWVPDSSPIPNTRHRSGWRHIQVSAAETSTQNSHDRAQRSLQKPSIFGKTARIMGEGRLEPYDLNLCSGYLATLKLAVHVYPIDAEWQGNLCCGRSIP